ncbi:universal stress protein [Bdellovibrionota bacterium FG-1]
MDTQKRPLRVVWAVDPSNQAALFSKSISQVLRYFSRSADTIIEPVYILKIAPEISGEFSAKWRPQYGTAAEKMINQLTHELKVENVAPPKVIFHDSMSTRGAADALADHASLTRADLIIAQTHSRKGLQRLFLGSFAETLLFQAKVPVMLIGKEMKSFRGFHNILFPTDFGDTSRAQLNRVIDLALPFKAHVTLFHSVRHPVEPVWTTFYTPGALAPFIDYVQREVDLATRKAKSWQEIAKTRGIRLTYVIDEKGLGVWDHIVSLANKKNIGLIAMEAQSGPVASTLLGSITRQVVRHAPCPVLVLKAKSARVLKLPVAA